MTEQELQRYLLSKYPKENEGCEWKEFKNMKNDFNGKEKDDVISYPNFYHLNFFQKSFV